MVAIPTRERVGAYRGHRQLVNRLIGRIHGQFATPGWSPVHYLYRSLTQAELAGLYRAADVMLVTPLRDGMNLVAKEYVSCQSEEKGVLLVSHLAGAAEELTDALVINPYDLEGVADSIRQALEMPMEERRNRMRRMRDYLATHDIKAWADECLRDAGLLPQDDSPSIV